jgi:transcriptional regulator with XRE-family HTH domain
MVGVKRINPKTLPSILRRLKALRIAIKGDGPGAQAAFAKESGIQAPNWNTYERQRHGQRIGVDAAMKLVEKWDVTLDYIYYGRRHGVEQPLWESLQAAEKYVIEQEEQERREEEAAQKTAKKRA